MVNRKGIRCGARGCRYFSGLWRAKKIFQLVGSKTAFRETGTPSLCLRKGSLLADDGGFGRGDFQTHEAMVGVEVENDLDIAGRDFQAFVGFAFGGESSG